MVSAQGVSLSVQTASRAQGTGTVAPSSLLPLADRCEGAGQGQPPLTVRARLETSPGRWASIDQCFQAQSFAGGGHQAYQVSFSRTLL